MSKANRRGKGRRRGGRAQGHPGRRTRPVDRRGTPDRADPDPREVAALVADAFAAVQTPEDAEYGASTICGSWWRRLGPMRRNEEAEHVAAIVDELRRRGDAVALAALRGFEHAGTEPIASTARAAATGLAAGDDAPPEPAWLDAVAGVRPTAAARIVEQTFGDAETVVVEFERPDGERHCVAVVIDRSFGGGAVDLAVADPLDDLRRLTARAATDPGQLERPRILPESLDDAKQLAGNALRISAMTIGLAATDDFTDLRGLAERRLDLIPGEVGWPDWEPMPDADRDALVDGFVGTPEGAPFADDEARDIVATAIDFSWDYVDQQPWRWSPQVVERFLGDFVLRKIVADDAYLHRIPDVLAAWVRHAGLQRGVPAEATERTLAAIEEHREDR